jgi:hypothetical protein
MRFRLIINPTGIIYNPLSIAACLDLLIEKKQFEESSLVFAHEVWFSFQHHGRFSDPDKTRCLAKINHELKQASDLITKTDLLFLTFGTAFIYRKKDSGEVVANCHKFPSGAFTKELLKPGEIVSVFKETIKKLVAINPEIRIIFTVSPVRHWNDSASGNQLSKSILLVALHELVKEYPRCFYFPAYELMMDDLRDYRFYAADMIHPNDIAIEYIREKFTETFIEKDCRKVMEEIQKLIQASKHKPFNAGTPAHAQFRKAMRKEIAELKKSHPALDLEEFDEYFRD